MFGREFSTPKINLSRKPGELPFDVGMEAFFEFSFWMAEELTDLIAQHECDERKRKTDKLRRMLIDSGRISVAKSNHAA
jgi:hypothetical protein